MGARGPAPTPSAVLNARGSWRGKANKNEPRPEPGAPSCPKWLTADAKKVWKEMVKLIAPGVLTRDNGLALARYCESFVRWKKAAAFLAAKGEVYTLKDDAGEIKCVMPWPQVAIYGQLATLLSRLEADFGLTPASRSRIAVIPEPPAPRKAIDSVPVMRIASA